MRVAQQQWWQSNKQIANNLAPLNTAIRLMLRGLGGMAVAWLRFLWLAAATVVRDVLCWLRGEENFHHCMLLSRQWQCCRQHCTATATAMAIQGRQLNNGDWMTTMGRLRCDDDGQPATCRMLASAVPPIQGKNQLMWTTWGGGDNREGQFGGVEPQKRVEVELIEWRSIDLHSIDSKSTFCPPQSGKRTGIYSACVLAVRLRYQRHGKHVYCCRHLCHRCDGVIAIVDVKLSLPSL